MPVSLSQTYPDGMVALGWAFPYTLLHVQYLTALYSEGQGNSVPILQRNSSESSGTYLLCSAKSSDPRPHPTWELDGLITPASSRGTGKPQKFWTYPKSGQFRSFPQVQFSISAKLEVSTSLRIDDTCLCSPHRQGLGDLRGCFLYHPYLQQHI